VVKAALDNLSHHFLPGSKMLHKSNGRSSDLSWFLCLPMRLGRTVVVERNRDPPRADQTYSSGNCCRFSLHSLLIHNSTKTCASRNHCCYKNSKKYSWTKELWQLQNKYFTSV